MTNVSSMYRVITSERVFGQAHFQCVVRPNMLQFLQGCGQLFHTILWSSCTSRNLNAARMTCFPALNTETFKDFITQDRCREASCTLSDVNGVPSGSENRKPIFLKFLEDEWHYEPEFTEENTLLVDDTRYKTMPNPWNGCICPTTFDPEDADQDPYFLTLNLLPWLLKCRASPTPRQYVNCNMMYNSKDTLSSIVMEHHSSLQQSRNRR